MWNDSGSPGSWTSISTSGKWGLIIFPYTCQVGHAWWTWHCFWYVVTRQWRFRQAGNSWTCTMSAYLFNSWFEMPTFPGYTYVLGTMAQTQTLPWLCIQWCHDWFSYKQCQKAGEAPCSGPRLEVLYPGRMNFVSFWFQPWIAGALGCLFKWLRQESTVAIGVMY